MRQFFKILFACFFALVLFVVVTMLTLTGIVAGLSSGSEKKMVDDHSILRIDLNQEIKEQSREGLLHIDMVGDSEVLGLNDIIRSLHEAANDDNIKGVFLKMGTCPNGWATLKEIREALLDFKQSKKFIVAYGEVADQKSYYVGSTADQIFLHPSGMIEFKGLAINSMFFKGALDKLDITTEAFHCGKFKGAYEPFKLEKFSDPNRYQLGVLLQDMYAEFLSAVSEKTKIDTATLTRMANQGTIRFPQDALANHFVDALLYSDSVNHFLQQKIQVSTKEKLHWVDCMEYASSLNASSESKNKVAILYAEGEIHDGEGNDGIYSETFVRNIRKISEDDNIKAVVLRVNSPGGSAMASEVIYHELAELKKKKPVIISMGNYAASGGYYISCAGDSVFADNNTLTGSIGVVGVMFNIEKMMKNKLGVTFDQVKTSEYADFPNMNREMTESERAWIQGYLDTTYVLFKSRVANARHLTMEEVEELAQGHVYSGKLALQLKLIDGFGNKESAIACASRMAKLKDYRLVEYPKPMSKLDEILQSISGEKREEAMAKKILGADYVVYKELKKIREQENKIQAILPYTLDIR
jgi:protease-4